VENVDKPVDKRCGYCAYWHPEVKAETGSLMFTDTLPHCKFFSKGIRHVVIKNADSIPESWCWYPASNAQIESRIKAGLI